MSSNWSYHNIFDDRSAPSLIIHGYMWGLSIRAVKAALHIIAIIEQHTQHHLILKCVLKGRREVGGVDTGVVVHIGTVAEQSVD